RKTVTRRLLPRNDAGRCRPHPAALPAEAGVSRGAEAGYRHAPPNVQAESDTSARALSLRPQMGSAPGAVKASPAAMARGPFPGGLQVALSGRCQSDEDHRRAMQPRIGLALGSGVARGWAHIGILRVLEREGVQADIVAGTSIGALVGGVWLAGQMDTLEAWARSLNRM